jgi:hypothetical protein
VIVDASSSGHGRRFAPMGLWKLPDPRTRKRPRAHRSLDAGERGNAPVAVEKRQRRRGQNVLPPLESQRTAL